MTNEDYEKALVRADELMDARPGTPEFVELDRLADEIAAHERQQDCETCRGTGRLWNSLLGDFIRCVDCQLAPGEM